jgi:hypothetical protein
MSRISTRAAVKQSLRRERDGLIADLDTYKQAKTGGRKRYTGALCCGLCKRQIPDRSLTAVDHRPFHIGCANRLLRDEMAALGAVTVLALRRTVALVERTVHLVRQNRALCG